MRSYPLCLVAPFLVAITAFSQEAAPRPLPELAELIRKLQANQRNVEELRRNYICTVQQEITRLDGDGKVKSQERRKYEQYYVAGEPIRRLISQDGITLDKDDQKKEAKRVAKREKEARERRAKRERGEAEKDEITVADFLQSSRFLNLRRELRNDREMLAMDFEPNPDYKPRSRAQNLINRLEGRIWVDENDLQVTRLEARLIKGMRFAGFLASVKEGSHLVLEQQRLNEEVWMPSVMDGTIGARMLFAGVNQRLINRFSNYQKFGATSTIRGVVDEKPR